MSVIVYYSNRCPHSKSLLQKIARAGMQKEMHFICVDRRVRGDDGSVRVILANGQQVTLPPTVTQVPALLLMSRGNRVLTGSGIDEYMSERMTPPVEAEAPMAFSFDSGSHGVTSDGYSFLDMAPSDLESKGDGGLRQMHHYASIDLHDKIETPPDTYQPERLSGSDMERFQKERDAELPQPRPRA